MNKTNFKSLDISEEEISAVQRYISNAHISMNSMLDIDPDVLSKLDNKGWLIDLSQSSIEKNTEYLAKLYSAMYKATKQRMGSKEVVYRGTSIDEVGKLKKNKESGRFLSTTTDKEIAMRFTEYQRGAILTLAINSDVPYIVADEFLGETQVSESEILISPFSTIENIEAYSVQDIEGVSRYSATLSKKEFKNISQEEKEKYQEEIYSFDFPNELEKYKDISSRLEIISNKIEGFGTPSTKDEREELSYMREQQSKLYSQLSEAKERFAVVKTAMNAILQDRFKTVEQEIDKGLEQDLKEFEEAERTRKVELEKERKVTLISDAEKTLTQIEVAKLNYATRDYKEQEICNIGAELGVDVSQMSKVDPDVLAKFEELKDNVERIKKEIQDIQIPDNLSKEEMSPNGALNKNINELYEKLNLTKKVLDECSKVIFEEKEKNKELLSRKISTSMGNLISSKAKENLLKEQEELLSKKDSLWDKLTGKSKIKSARLKNLTLRMELIQSGGLNMPDNLEEMQTYVEKYKAVLGTKNLPEPLKTIFEEQSSEVQMTDEEKMMFEMLKPQTALIPKGKSQGDVLSTLQKQNSSIESRIQGLQVSKNTKSTLDLEKKTKNSVERCLDTAIFYTSKLTEEQKKSIVIDKITL